MVYLFSLLIIVGFLYYGFHLYSLDKSINDSNALREQYKSKMDAYIKNEIETINNAIESYLKANACLCKWDKLQYWLGKEQGPAWQDSLQNRLVETILALPLLEKQSEDNSSYDIVTIYECLNCNSLWHHTSHEWKMLCYHHKLVKPDNEITSEDKIISQNIFSIAGREPGNEYRKLSLNEWSEHIKSPNKRL